MESEQKRSPFYKNFLFWFLLLLIGCVVFGFVKGDELPNWLEFIRRLLR